MKKENRLEKEQKGSKTRLQKMLDGEKVDRVPFFPLHISGFSSRNTGYPLGTMYSDPDKSFWAQVWTQEQYGFEYMPMYNYASYGAWEFGGEIKFPSSEFEQAPSIIRYPVESEKDIERIESDGLPEVRARGSIPLNVEFSKLQEKYELPIVFLCGTPFTRAGNLCGVEKLLRWTMKAPELAHRLIQLVTDHLVEVAQYWVDIFGAENLIAYSGNPTEANQLISPKKLEEFALPYTKELNEKVLAKGVKRFKFHVCGEQNLNLPLLAKVPLGLNGIVSFGHEVDIEKAIEYFGESNIVVGNINPMVIHTGTAQEIYELARACIEKGKKAPKGFMLSQGCQLSPLTPPYNVYMMKKAIDDFGQYD